jgi:NTP pyrophosphatase (non-canonical NTP hydrolase)
MTRNQFASICEHYLIAPEVALEVQEVREAIRTNNLEALEDALRNNF